MNQPATGPASASAPPQLEAIRMVDKKSTMQTFNLRSAATIHNWVAEGTMVPFIQLSSRCSRLLASEVQAIAAARAAGASKDELRRLVGQLLHARKRLMPTTILAEAP